MRKIRIGLVGIGNCASALIQGFHYYRGPGARDAVGLMHTDIAGYGPGDIEVACAFDIDGRKVGRDLSEAIFAPPNCTAVFCPHVPPMDVRVQMGPILDGVAEHMYEHPIERSFLPAELPAPDRDQVVRTLRDSGTEILLNYLPVGSERASRFYAECALEAGVALINGMPVFIASDPDWARRFAERGLPMIGDDIKAQVGATITHRALADLFRRRGVKLDRTYQLNTGGNTDFLNMLDRVRLGSKRISKVEAVQSALGERLSEDAIHVGPSDYVVWQKDNKVCFIRMEGRIFGSVPVNLELRLSVEDSPNSAGVAIDAIRCCKLALERGEAGVLRGPSAYFCKHPPQQTSDDEACRLTEAFIARGGRRRRELGAAELAPAKSR